MFQSLPLGQIEYLSFGFKSRDKTRKQEAKGPRFENAPEAYQLNCSR